MGKRAALDAWLERALDRDVDFWGTEDCFLWPADWVVACGWPDPAEGRRGRYASAGGAARLVKRAGGGLSLWRAEAARIGLSSTPRPRAGDVGLVRSETRVAEPVLRGVVGGIALGGGEWAVRTPGGLRTGRWPLVEAWRVPWLK